LNISENIFEMGETVKESSQTEKTLINTDIEIQGIVLDTGDITVSLYNQGKSKLWNFEKFDVIMTYDNAIGRKTDNLTFTKCPADDGYWCIQEIQEDIEDPQILNPFETALIIANATLPIISPGELTLYISTDNGDVTSASMVT
jgi:hypothetical protein